MTFIAETREGATSRITGTLVDETGTGITLGYLVSVTLTLTDQETGAVINSRDQQDVLNANDVTIDANGNLTWILAPEDNVILSSTINSLGIVERHVALFEWVYATSRKGNCEIYIDVSNVPGV